MGAPNKTTLGWRLSPALFHAAMEKELPTLQRSVALSAGTDIAQSSCGNIDRLMRPATPHHATPRASRSIRPCIIVDW